MVEVGWKDLSESDSVVPVLMRRLELHVISKGTLSLILCLQPGEVRQIDACAKLPYGVVLADRVPVICLPEVFNDLGTGRCPSVVSVSIIYVSHPLPLLVTLLRMGGHPSATFFFFGRGGDVFLRTHR